MTSYVVDWQLEQKPCSMFSNVIVPLDGSELSEQIVPYAEALAIALSAPLEFLHVVDPVNIEQPREEDARRGPFLDQLLEQREGWARSYLIALAKPLRERDCHVEVRVVVGRPEECIVDAALPAGHCLVVMATHGRSGMGRLFLGSVADRVLHRSRSPVLLYHPTTGITAPDHPPGTILVPLDGSTLAEAALPVARSIARRLKARVLLTSVIGAYEENGEEDAEARAYLDEQVHRLCRERINAGSALSAGDPAREIIHMAGNEPASLIVMSTHGRSGLARTVLGSVADRVIREAGVPVLIVPGVEPQEPLGPREW